MLYRPHGLRALGQICQARRVDFMPDALKIVPPLIEEICKEEEDGDSMEIDGWNAGDTLAACAQCLLECLNPATAESAHGEFDPISRSLSAFC